VTNNIANNFFYNWHCIGFGHISNYCIDNRVWLSDSLHDVNRYWMWDWDFDRIGLCDCLNHWDSIWLGNGFYNMYGIGLCDSYWNSDLSHRMRVRLSDG
jgi:hypothetical protein